MTNFSNDTQTGIVVADAFALADGTPIVPSTGGGGYTVLAPGGSYTLKSGESYLVPDSFLTTTNLTLPKGDSNSAITIAYFSGAANYVTINTVDGDEINTSGGLVSSVNLISGVTTMYYTSNWVITLISFDSGY